MSPKEDSHYQRVLSDICVGLAERLRKLREQRNWTQTYLSVHTGLGKRLFLIERGRKEPCLRSLEILADGFEMSLSQFLRRV